MIHFSNKDLHLRLGKYRDSLIKSLKVKAYRLRTSKLMVQKRIKGFPANRDTSDLVSDDQLITIWNTGEDNLNDAEWMKV